MAMAQFGGSYKKNADLKEKGFTKTPLWGGAGKEQCADLWQVCEECFAEKFIQPSADGKKLVNTLVTTTWSWGVASDYYGLQHSPNGIGHFKYLASGEMSTLLVSLHELVPAMRQHYGTDAVATKDCHSTHKVTFSKVSVLHFSAHFKGMHEYSQPPSSLGKDIHKHLSAANEGYFKELAAFGVQPHQVLQKAGDILYVPTGYVVAEKVTSGVLVYGTRRSAMAVNDVCTAAYEQYIAVSVQDGTSSKDKMDELLQVMMPE
eukprot:6462587-Amphidinium_carterae.2